MNSERGQSQDLKILTAYLDGSLKGNKRERFNDRLSREPELRQWLDNLRQTRTILGQLPRIKAPRNFTLSPEMVSVRSRKRQPLVMPLRVASSLAAVLLVVLLGAEYLFAGGQLSNRAMLEAPRMESASEEMEEAAPEPLIQWGDPSAEGKGGGATISEAPMVDSAAPEAEIDEEQEAPPAEKQIPQEVSEADAAAERDMILGINPDQAGEVIDRNVPPPAVEESPVNWQKLFRLTQVGLAILAIGGGLTLLILRRRRTS